MQRLVFVFGFAYLAACAARASTPPPQGPQPVAYGAPGGEVIWDGRGQDCAAGGICDWSCDEGNCAFHCSEALVCAHRFRGAELLFARANNVDAVERRLLRDSRFVAAIGEAVVGDRQHEVLSHVVPLEHSADAQADRRRTAQRPLGARDRGRDLGE